MQRQRCIAKSVTFPTLVWACVLAVLLAPWLPLASQAQAAEKDEKPCASRKNKPIILKNGSVLLDQCKSEAANTCKNPQLTVRYVVGAEDRSSKVKNFADMGDFWRVELPEWPKEDVMVQLTFEERCPLTKAEQAAALKAAGSAAACVTQAFMKTWRDMVAGGTFAPKDWPKFDEAFAAALLKEKCVEGLEKWELDHESLASVVLKDFGLKYSENKYVVDGSDAARTQRNDLVQKASSRWNDLEIPSLAVLIKEAATNQSASEDCAKAVDDAKASEGRAKAC